MKISFIYTYNYSMSYPYNFIYKFPENSENN